MQTTRAGRKQVGQGVTRENLPFIHLVPGEVAACLDVAQSFHQEVNLTPTSSFLCRILQQPSTESRIERFASRAGNEPRLLDQVRVGTESHVFHTYSVYTPFRVVFLLAFLETLQYPGHFDTGSGGSVRGGSACWS